MDTNMRLQKSLPPSVEGKIHGYLKFVVDEVIWSNFGNFGEIKVFLSWWGETDKSEFRPADITKSVTRPIQEITETYAIRTNISLFEEYVKNCECLELTIVSEDTNMVLGTSQVTDLLEIFKFKPYFRYLPIVTDCGNKIGEVHVNIKLELLSAKSSNSNGGSSSSTSSMRLKPCKLERKQTTGNDTSIEVFTDESVMKTNRYVVRNRRENKPEQNETYKSILKLRKTEFQEPINKFNNDVTDKLVARVVARAQKLRGAILKETYDDDGSSSDGGSNSSDRSNDQNIKLMSSNENESLRTLSLTDLTSSSSLKASKCDNRNITGNNIPFVKIDAFGDDMYLRELGTKRSCINSKDFKLFDLVDHVEVTVKSFALSPAGYRRVKSSSISNNDNIFSSATFFVQYNMTFDYMKENEQKQMRERKPVRISSKKQESDRVIYFDHRSMYSVPKLKRSTEWSVKFKVFVRHRNKKSLIELGNATVCLETVIKTENWRLEQELIIVNKGIKVGDLSVIIELGSNHFNRYIVDNMTSAKENIPTLGTQRLLDETRNKRAKGEPRITTTTTTTTASSGGNDVSSISTEEVNLTGNRNSVTKSRFIAETIDDKNIDTKNYENNIEDKVLLHGLIYIAEGRELPELDTYLICRAFWTEDKTKSQVCHNTKNPFYKFLQLVPLIYDLELLERIKDNYIVIEVYSRTKNNTDNLLGLTKLSLHQLYVAYRDPRVLPHLLLSKCPVISVDGWIPIVDPVTGQFRGQLLVLVALGSGEQIALLEMSRGLRTIGTSLAVAVAAKRGTMHLSEVPDSANCSLRSSETNASSQHRNFTQSFPVNIDRQSYRSSNTTTRECQTDITTVKEYKIKNESREKVASCSNSSSTLNDTVDHKMNVDQAAQTEICNMELAEKAVKGNSGQNGEEHICTCDELQLNHLNSDDSSDSNSVRHNYHLPTGPYTRRSVGVGAEYDQEEIDQRDANIIGRIVGRDNVMTCNELSTTRTDKNDDSENVTRGQTMFRAIVEIECALHLPKVEKLNETVEPTTYASFQATKNDHTRHENSYAITNVYPRSCNPKWNWKCETELSADLLVHNEKRLIVKIWRIIEPDIDIRINLERDVVIGFSAIDLTVLLSGFPQVSGWFHIIDFTGKCNGQIKACITPLDNLSLLLGKPPPPGCMLNMVQSPASSIMQQLNQALYSYESRRDDITRNNINCAPTTLVTQVDKEEEKSPKYNGSQSMNTGFEDVSMSFLSLSLKQKLTELDEITKRLESRLHDVTSTAFEIDDLENEFEQSNSDAENNDCKGVRQTASVPPVYTDIDCHGKTAKCPEQGESNAQNYLPRANTNFCCEPTVSHCGGGMQQPSELMPQKFQIFDNNITEYPERGTKTDINYLLDKLSLNLPTKSRLTTAIGPTREILRSSLSLTPSNGSISDNNTRNEESNKMRVVPTQIDDTCKEVMQTSRDLTKCTSTITSKEVEGKESSDLPSAVLQTSKIFNKMSMVIRDELIAEEENNNSTIAECDELTGYLLTSNIRHMDLNNIFGPLFSPYLSYNTMDNKSPEEETVAELDNRYTEAFSASINREKLSKAQNLSAETPPVENAKVCRMIPSGISSENINDNVDSTILRKTGYNDPLLLATSSITESTTTISGDNDDDGKSINGWKSVDCEMVENCDSATSELATSVPVVTFSRQAPDGGNPIEDTRKLLITQQQNDEIQHSLSSSSSSSSSLPPSNCN